LTIAAALVLALALGQRSLRQHCSRASVWERTDCNGWWDHLVAMKQNRFISDERPPHSTRTDDRLAPPLDVFYVVQTTAGASGERSHRIRSALFETRHQARTELTRLRAASAGSSTYDIWTAARYVEPAEWLYDVVMADGSVIRSRRNRRVREHSRICDAPRTII
jgi:hypothetical protein